MGLFDHISVKYKLPDPEAQDLEFQSKDTESQFLDQYEITEQGRLMYLAHETETVPEEERPYFNDPKFQESPLLKMCGMIRRINERWEDTNFHGFIRFYAGIGKHGTDGYKWFEYTAKFTDGNICSKKTCNSFLTDVLPDWLPCNIVSRGG